MVSPINLPGPLRPGPEPFSGARSAESRDVVSNQAARQSEAVIIRTADDAISVLRARLTQRLEQALGEASFVGEPRVGNPSFGAPSFEAPSAEQVAQNVLGFVQQRLQSEASAGADADRLAGLLADARAGVKQGFAEAREQIEAMGLMNNQLGADIDDSFSRIENGLTKLGEQFGSLAPEIGANEPVEAAGYRLEKASESLFSFEVNTTEGDRVTVRMAEQAYFGASVQTSSRDRGQSAGLTVVGGFSGRYAFSIEGDLNSTEQKALTQLFSEVERVSNRFFDGDIQGAFRKAEDLNLGGDALASFSLSLTSTRMVSAAAYESIAQQPSANAQLRPLGNLARDIQSVAQSAFDRGLPESTFEGLMNSLLEDIRQWQSERAEGPKPTSDSLMSEFMSATIQSVNPTLLR